MIKKIEKEIKKLEILKEQKINKRNQLDEELSEITTQLKELYSLKNQYDLFFSYEWSIDKLKYSFEYATKDLGNISK